WRSDRPWTRSGWSPDSTPTRRCSRRSSLACVRTRRWPMPVDGTTRATGAARGPVRLATSVATVSLSGTLREKLEAAAAAGFAEVEIFEHDFLSGPQSAEDVRELCRDLGLVINLFQ